MAFLAAGSSTNTKEGTVTQQTAGIQSYLLPLQKGFYTIRVEYLAKQGKPSLDILYAPENGNGGIIPMELRYGDAK